MIAGVKTVLEHRLMKIMSYILLPQKLLNTCFFPVVIKSINYSDCNNEIGIGREKLLTEVLHFS